MDNNSAGNVSRSMPLLPLRGISVFPGMVLNFDVERKISVAALNRALAEDQMIFLVAQRDIATDDPQKEDLFLIGTVCRLKQLLRVPGGSATIRVMVEGVSRGRLLGITAEEPCFMADVAELEDETDRRGTVRSEALVRQCCSLFDEYCQLAGNQSPEVLLSILGNDDPGYVADYVAQNIYLKHTQKQLILEELRPLRRLAALNRILMREINILSVEQSIQEATQEQIAKSQKDMYLREQIRVIQAELGDTEDTGDELDEYRQRIRGLHLDAEIEDKLLKEVSHLAKQPFGSSEAAVSRNYLDACLELPWNVRTKDVLDIAKAKKALDDDHYGLDKVKERILEYLAVRSLAPGVKGSTLCLVGPPGTGKTSIAISIARAMNRKLTRISLGGVHDEAEIRGHRKTYVGSMPGRIIAGITQAGSCNPVMVLDEIDKLGSDYRGDPSSALLEALDPEQNSSFRDHFLEIPFDLSEVFFITTANTTDTIPRALLDRMEVIELGSYTDEEKLCIAKNYLIPRQRRKHGLNGTKLRISDGAVREIIAMYTRESGVRQLEREIAAVCRKAAYSIATGDAKSVSVKAGSLGQYLGSPKYKNDAFGTADEVGLVRGLAWTAVGGEVLEVEVGVMDGTGKLELTGNLGDVMKESAKAAVSFIRSKASSFGIDCEFYKNKDIHIHFPEGAVPKDGPSAGITICVGLISALTGVPVRRDVAMTGEITLRGRVLPIGGLKEKTMAAMRCGVHTVIIPAGNEKDLEEIDQTVRKALNFVLTDNVEKILGTALNMNIKLGESAPIAQEKIPASESRERGSAVASIRQ